MFQSATDYNYRAGRFANVTYPCSTEKMQQWSVFPAATGILEQTNNHVELTSCNKLIIQLFDKEHKGYFIDDVGALYGRMLQSVAQDQYRQDAFICNVVGLISQDNRAVSKHGYSSDQTERESPPDKKKLQPTKEEWMAIYERAFGGQ